MAADLYSGGIDNGARVVTVYSSGESRVSPKVRLSLSVSHPARSNRLPASSTGLIMRSCDETVFMAGSLITDVPRLQGRPIIYQADPTTCG